MADTGSIDMAFLETMFRRLAEAREFERSNPPDFAPGNYVSAILGTIRDYIAAHAPKDHYHD